MREFASCGRSRRSLEEERAAVAALRAAVTREVRLERAGSEDDVESVAVAVPAVDWDEREREAEEDPTAAEAIAA